jgi:ribonuclease Z
MPRHFDPTLVNDPFDDPGLYVDLVFERRALLFDLGDIARLSPRKILRISDVFVTHRHMDHFAGFDQLLRRVLGRQKMLGLYGPTGTIDAVEHKLKAYTWNLIDEYGGNLVCSVTEVDEAGRQTSAKFCGRTRFERSEVETRQADDGLLHKEPGFQVRATTLDHGVPVLAFALEERVVGPWLRGFKEAILRGADDDVLVDVGWAAGSLEGLQLFPLGCSSGRLCKSPLDARLSMWSIALSAMLTVKKSFGLPEMQTSFSSKRLSLTPMPRSLNSVTI